MKARNIIRVIVSVMMVATIVPAGTLKAQDANDYDSAYVISYADMLTGRLYISQKYTLFAVEAREETPQLQYRPNTTVNLGVGATFRSLTLNLAYGFPFLNRDNEKGRTKYLDLQSHLYGYKWSIDLFGQFYKGYYLYPRGLGADAPEHFYLRPDLFVQEVGLHAYYIFNHNRFSYRAAFVQDAWQKKSAGSFMLGGGITYGLVRADSAFVPSQLMDDYLQAGVNGLRYFELGPGAAYAYTYVFREHWFATAAATISLDVGLVRESQGESNQDNRSFSPNLQFRAVAGYNGPVWNLNFSWVTNRTSINGRYHGGGYHVTTGNYRFTLAKRFSPGNKMKRFLKKQNRALTQ